MKSSAVLSNNVALTTKWLASLCLKFEKRKNKTVAAQVKHVGPLRIQRPFYPEEDGTCHVYLLHPPGGVVGGDELNFAIQLKEHAECFMTTPGATKIYRSESESFVNQDLVIAANATLQWLPQENIVFDQAISKIQTRLHLAATSRVFYWDVCCLGRPSITERFRQGCLRQSVALYRAGKPVIIEKNQFAGGQDIMHAVWGLQSHYVNALAIMTDNKNHGVAAYRQGLDVQGNQLLGLTCKNGFIICRYLGDSTEQAKAIFTRLWQRWRKLELQKEDLTPRIWNT